MKKLVLLILLFPFVLVGQIQTKTIPKSLTENISINSIKSFELSIPDINQLNKQDLEREKVGKFYRVAKAVDASIDLTISGATTQLKSGQIIRTKIKAKHAKALGLYFDKFKLAKGATIHVYDTEYKTIYGAFTHKNNKLNGVFSIRPFVGSELIIELFEPADKIGQSIVHIDDVSYCYRGFKDGNDFGDAGNCLVNVNCNEGKNWKDERNSVVRIFLRTYNEFGWCTGTLMNNTAGDCSPLILSADHCNRNTDWDEARTKDYNQWIFYFNYQSPNCANPADESGLNNETVTGCTRLAVAGTYADEDSDFLLVRLKDSIPDSYNAYYAGWTREKGTSNTGISMHHPSGDIKKISTFSNTPISDTWSGVVQNTHWRIKWDATSNGHSVTEGGSSGGSIMNDIGLVFGTLTGGNTTCDDPTTGYDYFGKLNWGWNPYDSTNDKRLDIWLDPLDLGYLTLLGTYKPCQVSQNITTADSNNNKIIVYPNPANDWIFIKTEFFAFDIIKVELIDITGKIVLKEESNDSYLYLNTNDLHSGIYFLKVTSETTESTSRLIISNDD